jgi:hypothetical protein
MLCINIKIALAFILPTLFRISLIILFLIIKFGSENIEEDFYKLKFYYPNSTLIPEAEKIIIKKNN